MQYALVEGDLSKYNGLVLNHYTDAAKECIDFLMKGMASNEISFIDDISPFYGIKYKTALVVIMLKKLQ